MTTGTGITTAEGAASGFDRDWQSVRGDEAIQFAPVKAPPGAETPDWLKGFFEFLGNLLRPLAELMGSAWPIGKWVLLALAVLALLVILWRLIEPAIRLRRAGAGEAEPEWLPDREAALALLEDADRLAAQGDFDQATHLLLKRSVGQIASARPNWLDPSSTAREIAALPALPQAARSAFATIADRVERSLFALRRLDAQDWQAARTAYSEFALADLTREAAA